MVMGREVLTKRRYVDKVMGREVLTKRRYEIAQMINEICLVGRLGRSSIVPMRDLLRKIVSMRDFLCKHRASRGVNLDCWYPLFCNRLPRKRS